jgi:hypothetical protein
VTVRPLALTDIRPAVPCELLAAAGLFETPPSLICWCGKRIGNMEGLAHLTGATRAIARALVQEKAEETWNNTKVVFEYRR